MQGLLKKFVRNVKKPQSNILGKIQLKDMNKRHNNLALWGLEHINLTDKGKILDIGCGGGKNLANLLNQAPNAKIYGVDYSKASVKMSQKFNAKAINRGVIKLRHGTAEALPFHSKSMDVITAFETIYFWKLDKGFSEVYRVLNNNGLFMITNEALSDEGMENIINAVEFIVYTPKQIELALKKAGFVNIQTDIHKNGKWLNIISQKLEL